MHTTAKPAVLAAALACGVFAATVVGAAQPQANDPAAAVTEQRPVGAVKAIELAGPYRVVVDAQAGAALSVSRPRDEVADVETTMRGDALVVRPRARDGWPIRIGTGRHTEPVTVRIGAAGLASPSTSGSGDVDLNRLAGDAFTFALNGPGNVRADDVRAGRIDATMRGPGAIKLAGPGGELRLDSAGSGDFDGCNLAVERAHSVQHGPGNACIAGKAASAGSKPASTGRAA